MSRKPSSLVPPLARDVAAGVVIEPILDESWPQSGLGPVEQIMDLIPDPTGLEPGSWVAISPGTLPRGRGLGALLRRQQRAAHLAVRCTALLRRGYTDLCADAAGTAFARVPG